MSLKVGLAQIHSLLGDIKSNLKKHLKLIQLARNKEIDLLAFPELSLTGYMLKDLAYELSDKCNEAISTLKNASHGMAILAGVVEEPRTGIYRNSMAVIIDGKLEGYIPKIYLPNYGLFEESRYFKPGDARDVRVFDYKGVKFGAVICEDAWHPEPVELVARLGADIVLIPSSSPLRGLYGNGNSQIEESWRSLVITRAIENTVYIGFVNRVGEEDEEYFWGGSMGVDPEGEILTHAKKLEEDLVYFEFDITRLRRARRFSSFKVHKRSLHARLSELP